MKIGQKMDNDLKNEFIQKNCLSSHDLLNPGPEAVALLHHVNLGAVGKYLHDADDQSFLGVVGGLVGIPLSHAPYVIIQGVAFRRVGRPYLLLKDKKQCLPASLQGPVGVVRRHAILLPDVGPPSGNMVHPGLHHVVQEVQVHVGVDLEAGRQEVWRHDVALVADDTHAHHNDR